MSAMQKGWVRGGWGSAGRDAIRRAGWQECRMLVDKYGWQVVARKDGSAELWDDESYCMGFLTRRSVELFNASAKPKRRRAAL